VPWLSGYEGDFRGQGGNGWQRTFPFGRSQHARRTIRTGRYLLPGHVFESAWSSDCRPWQFASQFCRFTHLPAWAGIALPATRATAMTAVASTLPRVARVNILAILPFF
jgi:hypothetical protein